MSFKSFVAAALVLGGLASPVFAEITVTDPYARSSNPMAGAAFMVISNSGPSDDRLIAVASDAAQRVELHTHLEDADGVMRMIHVEEGFVLPAGGEILMKRGGAHVMFMGLTAPFEQDAVIEVTLEFEQAGAIVVEVPVDQARMDSDAMSHGHSHDQTDNN